MIYEQVKTALDTLGVPVFADANREDMADSLPDLYLVYMVVSGNPVQSADDADTQRSYLVQVSVYNRNGLTTIPDVDAAMEAAGFRYSGERALAYDKQTGHYGVAREYSILM